VVVDTDFERYASSLACQRGVEGLLPSWSSLECITTRAIRGEKRKDMEEMGRRN
jgi:hypothetical protein